MQIETPHFENQRLLEMAVDIVSAYVSKNAMPVSELPVLIASVYVSLKSIDAGIVAAPVGSPKAPAISIKKSVTSDFIISLEDGRKFKSLKRHLSTAYGMTPEQYRTKWSLPHDYPMVAPNYAAARSTLAKSMGFGQKNSDRPRSLAKPRAKETPTKPAV